MPANVLPASSLFVFVCDYYNPLDLQLNNLQFDDVRFTIKVTTLYFIVKLFIPESNQPQSYHVYLKGIYP